MDIQMYQKHAKRTMNMSLPVNVQLSSLALGINGELGEVLELIDEVHSLEATKIGEEIGDIFWYIANLCSILNVELLDLVPTIPIMNRSTLLVDALISSSKLSDSIKKTIAQGHDLDIESIPIYLARIANDLHNVLMGLDLDLGSVLASNHLKLMQRYPNGFEAVRSINREV